MTEFNRYSNYKNSFGYIDDLRVKYFLNDFYKWFLNCESVNTTEKRIILLNCYAMDIYYYG